jgi:hypothetical protein
VGLLYVGSLVGFTVAFAGDVPAGGWAGLGVVTAIAAGLAVATIVLLERAEAQAGSDPVGLAPLVTDGRRRLLVVADVGCQGADSCPAILTWIGTAPDANVLVIAPAIVAPLHHLMDDDARERAAAGRRLDEIIGILAERGVRARGMVGADVPLEAIEDALTSFPADEILLLAPPPEHAAWSERDLADLARRTFGRPVTHIPVARR